MKNPAIDDATLMEEVEWAREVVILAVVGVAPLRNLNTLIIVVIN